MAQKTTNVQDDKQKQPIQRWDYRKQRYYRWEDLGARRLPMTNLLFIVKKKVYVKPPTNSVNINATLSFGSSMVMVVVLAVALALGILTDRNGWMGPVHRAVSVSTERHQEQPPATRPADRSRDLRGLLDRLQ